MKQRMHSTWWDFPCILSHTSAFYTHWLTMTVTFLWCTDHMKVTEQMFQKVFLEYHLSSLLTLNSLFQTPCTSINLLSLTWYKMLPKGHKPKSFHGSINFCVVTQSFLSCQVTTGHSRARKELRRRTGWGLESLLCKKTQNRLSLGSTKKED